MRQRNWWDKCCIRIKKLQLHGTWNVIYFFNSISSYIISLLLLLFYIAICKVLVRKTPWNTFRSRMLLRLRKITKAGILQVADAGVINTYFQIFIFDYYSAFTALKASLAMWIIGESIFVAKYLPKAEAAVVISKFNIDVQYSFFYPFEQRHE